MVGTGSVARPKWRLFRPGYNFMIAFVLPVAFGEATRETRGPIDKTPVQWEMFNDGYFRLSFCLFFRFFFFVIPFCWTNNWQSIGFPFLFVDELFEFKIALYGWLKGI